MGMSTSKRRFKALRALVGLIEVVIGCSVIGYASYLMFAEDLTIADAIFAAPFVAAIMAGRGRD